MAFKIIIFLTVAVLLSQIVHSQIGYASLYGGTRGGSGGPTVSVSTEAALINAVADNNPRIVRLTANIKLSGRVRVGSNKSILGAAPTAGVNNGGFLLKGVHNVVFQGLHLSSSLPPLVCIEIQRSTNVWVDHNDFRSDRNYEVDHYDGLLNIIRDSDWITVSWNNFYTHHKTSTSGNLNDHVAVDKGRSHVTFHHNYFRNVHSINPSIRFGTAHIFNNLFENIDFSTLDNRMGAQVFVENNVFINASRTDITYLDSREEGFEIDDELVRETFVTRNGKFPNPPYHYRVDTLENVATLVRRSAGATIRF